MESFEKAVQAQKQAEELGQLAITDLLKHRGEIDRKLAELGHKNGKAKSPCKVCGSKEHDGRAHRQKVNKAAI